MITPQNLSWKQVSSIFKILRLSSSSDLRTIKRWYNDESKNLEDTLSFLKELNIIKIKNGQIIPSEEFKITILENNQKIKSLFVNKFFNKEEILRPVRAFFDGFSSYGESYIYKPVIRERLKYSGIRNLLIDMGVLSHDQQLQSYISQGELSNYLRIRNKIFSYSQFKKESKKQEELGYRAEVLVYQQEKDIFKNDPSIQKKIRHVSLKNIMAGYDIVSFIKQKGGIILPIYIEVKAVSTENFKFYWSRNEIEKAKILRDQYFLYLLPVLADDRFDLESINKVRNPYASIINSNNWRDKCELMSFTKI